MNIVILGAGRIGSVFAFHLARAGHQVTVVARGERLRAIEASGAIETVDGRSAPVRAVAKLEASAAHDLAIVTVPEHQTGPLFEALTASATQTVLTMFNSFEQPASLATHQRLVEGFPTLTAYLIDQRLKFTVDGPGMGVAVGDADLAALLNEAGLPCTVEADMRAFLRSHVAFVLPMFLAALWSRDRRPAITWSEARTLSSLWTEGFQVVRELGHPIRPATVARLAGLPGWVSALALWGFAKTSAVRNMGQFGPEETRHLIDAMARFAPEQTRQLQAARP